MDKIKGDYYYKIRDKFFREPKAILPYKQNTVLVADLEAIEVVNISNVPLPEENFENLLVLP